MSTILVTTCYLNNDDYLKKTIKWVNFYSALDIADEILLLDNKSDIQNINLLRQNSANKDFSIHSFDEHFDRPSHLDYKYLWRGVDFYKEIFNRGHKKIIYTDNDFFILSQEMLDYVRNANSGWESPYCNMYNFPETGLQIVTKDYYQKLAIDSYMKYNGRTMETTLPLSNVTKTLVGDRYPEKNIKVQDKNWDYVAQTELGMNLLFGLKS